MLVVGRHALRDEHGYALGRAASQRSTSSSYHPTAFRLRRCGLGNSLARTSRQIVVRESPVRLFTSGTRRARRGSSSGSSARTSSSRWRRSVGDGSATDSVVASRCAMWESASTSSVLVALSIASRRSVNHLRHLPSYHRDEPCVRCAALEGGRSPGLAWGGAVGVWPLNGACCLAPRVIGSRYLLPHASPSCCAQ